MENLEHEGVQEEAVEQGVEGTEPAFSQEDIAREAAANGRLEMVSAITQQLQGHVTPMQKAQQDAGVKSGGDVQETTDIQERLKSKVRVYETVKNVSFRDSTGVEVEAYNKLEKNVERSLGAGGVATLLDTFDPADVVRFVNSTAKDASVLSDLSDIKEPTKLAMRITQHIEKIKEAKHEPRKMGKGALATGGAPYVRSSAETSIDRIAGGLASRGGGDATELYRLIRARV